MNSILEKRKRNRIIFNNITEKFYENFRKNLGKFLRNGEETLRKFSKNF